MNSLERNKEICNYHFLNNMNVSDKNTAEETGTVWDAPLSAVSTSQNFAMALEVDEETSQPNQPESLINQPEPVEKRTETVDISEYRNQLMELLNRKDKTIENLAFELQNMETRLQTAVNLKLDALARLDKIEGKEQKLLFKEKEMKLEVERLNTTIESLKEDLDKNVAELTATRKDEISISTQFKIEMKELSEKLRIANLSIDELSETNETLKAKNDHFERKLREQCDASAKLMKSYQNELKSKDGEIQTHKEKQFYYEAQIEELTNGFHELHSIYFEDLNEYEILGTRLQQCELDHQTELNAMDELITNMKQELKDANCLLKEFMNSNCDKNNLGDIADDANDLPTVADHPKTLTELYSQWRSNVKQLQSKEEECKMLEMEVKRVIEKVKENAIHFDEQQKELEKLKADNHKHIEERNCFLVEKMVSQEETEGCRLQCELLKNENAKLKYFGLEYLTKLFSNDEPNKTPKSPAVHVAGRPTNIVELKQQNEKLLAIINSLMEQLHGGNNELNTVVDALATSSASTSLCDKSVEVSEDDLPMANSSMHCQCGSGNADPKSQADNLLIIEDLKQDNFKLQNAKRELSAEKNLLLAEQSLFDVRYNFLQSKIDSQDKEKKKYVNIIEENGHAYKNLREENANLSMQLSTVKDRLVFVESQHRTLGHIKNALVVEVEAVKQERALLKVANKTLVHHLESMKKSLGRTKLELQMRRSDSTECRVMIQRWSAAKAEDQSHCNMSKISMDEAVQTDFKSESHRGRDADICNEAMSHLPDPNKKNYSHPLQLTSLEPGNTIAESSSQSNPSDRSSLRKRKSKTAAEDTISSSKKSQPKKARVSFVETVDLSEESDEETTIDVGGVEKDFDLPNIKLQYEARTRKQAKFIRDAFTCPNPESNLKPAQKVSNPKNTRCSGRSQSSGNVRASVNVRSSRRSRSTNSKVQKSNVDQQESKDTCVVVADCKVEKPNRQSSSKRSRSHSNVRSNARNGISARSRSTISTTDHQPPNARHQQSDVHRQHQIDSDCYIVQSTTNDFNPTGDGSNRSWINARRSHRLISRFIRLTRADQQKSNVDRQRPTDGNILQPKTNHRQSNAGHQKSNIDRQQSTDGHVNILQSTLNVIDNEEEFCPTDNRRSRRLIHRQS
ncbi:filamin A-interacting protein 1-like isoform X2 [Bradysia coprophila]|uniref:filamin A-interacting protein 1-like isoform X2 n=1 Tax=Bradysia coprophila TaxID=38358 RepID=UPI00187DCBC7|nr:filamin A-interacting protein 1-like isoform X2 [Bradysia coprophila]